MEESEIKKEIKRLENEVKELNKNQTKYENMNKKINNLNSELTNASKHINTAYLQLKKNYSSTIGNKKSEKLQDEYNSVTNMTKQIKQKILPASNSKIKEIKSSITQKNNRIRDLERELQNLSIEKK